MSSKIREVGEITVAGVARIAGLLAETHKTKAGLAAAWQVSPAQVSKFFSGHVRKLTATRAVSLAKYLGIELNDLLLILSLPDDIVASRAKENTPVNASGASLINSQHARNGGGAAFSAGGSVDLVVQQHGAGEGTVLVSVQVRVPVVSASRCTTDLLVVAQQYLSQPGEPAGVSHDSVVGG
jgi:plasmid maintenance system antidote protein VapI